MIHYAMPIDGQLANRYNPAHMTNDEVRRGRLAQLAAMHGGPKAGLKAIAAAIEPEPAKVAGKAQNLDHILSRRKSSHVREDKTQAIVSMGDELARRIERAFKLREGWMDWPFPGVDFDSYSQLSETQRALVQGRMIAAIEDASKTPSPALDQVNRPAVADKAVAKHIKPAPSVAPKRKTAETQKH